MPQCRGCLQGCKAAPSHVGIITADACLQWRDIVSFGAHDPLTPAINISAEHEGRADTIKTVLWGFHLQLAATWENRAAHICVETKESHRGGVRSAGQSYPHVKPLLCGKQTESLISFTLFWHARPWRNTLLILSMQQRHWFFFSSLRKCRVIFLVQWMSSSKTTFLRFSDWLIVGWDPLITPTVSSLIFLRQPSSSAINRRNLSVSKPTGVWSADTS